MQSVSYVWILYFGERNEKEGQLLKKKKEVKKESDDEEYVLTDENKLLYGLKIKRKEDDVWLYRYVFV